jgi:TonB family protein
MNTKLKYVLPLLTLVAWTECGTSALGQEAATYPQVITKIEPRYSDDARIAHLQGIIQLVFEVGVDGLPHNVKVLRSFDSNLDKNAIEAISQWRFRPGTKDGQPVSWNTKVEVTFQSDGVHSTGSFTPIGSSTPPAVSNETDEHRFARQRYEVALSAFNDVLRQRQALLDEVRRLQNQRFGNNIDQQEALLSQARQLGNQLNAANPAVDLLRVRMENADACAAIYPRTIDRKVSDLTTRETETVKACQTIGLYPPQK